MKSILSFSQVLPPFFVLNRAFDPPLIKPSESFTNVTQFNRLLKVPLIEVSFHDLPPSSVVATTPSSPTTNPLSLLRKKTSLYQPVVLAPLLLKLIFSGYQLSPWSSLFKTVLQAPTVYRMLSAG